MKSYLLERAQRVPHALHSVGMVGGPLRQHGESVMPQEGFMQGPATRARGPERMARLPGLDRGMRHLSGDRRGRGILERSLDGEDDRAVSKWELG